MVFFGTIQNLTHEHSRNILNWLNALLPHAISHEQRCEEFIALCREHTAELERLEKWLRLFEQLSPIYKWTLG